MQIRLLSLMQKIAPLTASTLLIIVVCLAINNWTQWKELHSTTMTCDAIVNVYKDRQQLSLRLKYSFLGEDGTATFSGVLEDGGKVSAHISRKVFFIYKRVNEAIYFENKKTIISQQDTAGPDGLKNLLPTFYTEPGARTNFMVYAQKPGGYVFVKDFTPAFYCAEQ